MKNQILTFLYYTSSYIALPKINTNSFYMLFVHKKKKNLYYDSLLCGV